MHCVGADFGMYIRFWNEDFRLLQSLLKSDIVATKVMIMCLGCMHVLNLNLTLQKAGLSPTVEQIDLFSSFIPLAKLHEVLVSACGWHVNGACEWRVNDM